MFYQKPVKIRPLPLKESRIEAAVLSSRFFLGEGVDVKGYYIGGSVVNLTCGLLACVITTSV